MNNLQQEKKETLLPPPELLERYEGISKGLSKDLVELVKKEQEHRHKLQDKYLAHFRYGQIFGSAFLIFVLYIIFDLAKYGYAKTAYGLAIIFGVLIIFILMQYKKDKLNAVRNANKKNIRRQNNNHRRNYTQRKSN